MAFGTKLRAERRRQDVTQLELAKAVGVKQVSISRYESGKEKPNFENAIKIAKYLNVSLDFLTSEED